MKRDFDLIRKILIAAEEQPAFEPWEDIEIEDYDSTIIAEHIQILNDAGLLDAEVDFMMSGEPDVVVKRLTWEGHEFINSIKDDTRWNKIKATATKASGGLVMGVLTEIAKKMAIPA